MVNMASFGYVHKEPNDRVESDGDTASLDEKIHGVKFCSCSGSTIEAALNKEDLNK